MFHHQQQFSEGRRVAALRLSSLPGLERVEVEEDVSLEDEPEDEKEGFEGTFGLLIEDINQW